LGDNCSVFQSELYAIFKSLLYLKNSLNELENIFKNNQTIKIGLFSDSKSALMSLQQYNNSNKLVHEIKSIYKQLTSFSKISLNFHWIKSHVGYYGNEIADSLAKDGCNLSENVIEFKTIPLSFVKKELQNQTLSE
jgi:ribonuclease HI